MEMKKIPVIIDCDPGIDDTVALAVAFAQPQFDILAVCAVAGNVSVDKTATNARAVLATIGSKCPIYRGAEGPLLPGRVIEAPDVHGVSGLGNFTMPVEELNPLEEESAVAAMHRIISASADKVTIIAIGPLTNLALLFRTYPKVKDNVELISLMGGGLYTGNHTAAAEFNILADPEAADIVYNSGVPIIMAGLDVTHKAYIGWKEYNELKAINNPVSEMLCDALKFSLESTGKVKGDMENASVNMHDTVSVLAITQPELFEGRDLHVVVETAGRYCRGYTLADMRGDLSFVVLQEQPNCHVLLNVDRENFNKTILNAVRSYGN